MRVGASCVASVLGFGLEAVKAADDARQAGREPCALLVIGARWEVGGMRKGGDARSDVSGDVKLVLSYSARRK